MWWDVVAVVREKGKSVVLPRKARDTHPLSAPPSAEVVALHLGFPFTVAAFWEGAPEKLDARC